MFSYDQIQQLLVAQYNLNIKYQGQDWYNKVDMKSDLVAIITEFAEFLESSPRQGPQGTNGWKWWRQNLEDDKQNMAVETIDVLHFVLTMILLSNGKEEGLQNVQSDLFKKEWNGLLNDHSYTLISKNNDFEKMLYSYTTLLTKVLEFDITPNNNRKCILVNSMQLLHYMGKICNRTSDELFEGYFHKNKLNQTRVENGYITGQYDKMASGEEDNKLLNV